MLIKAGVGIESLNREIRGTLGRAAVWVGSFEEELVILSTYEGDHAPGSAHYSDDAYDFGRPQDAHNREIDQFCELFNEDFRVVVQGKLIHIEYKPKRRSRAEISDAAISI